MSEFQNDSDDDIPELEDCCDVKKKQEKGKEKTEDVEEKMEKETICYENGVVVSLKSFHCPIAIGAFVTTIKNFSIEDVVEGYEKLAALCGKKGKYVIFHKGHPVTKDYLKFCNAEIGKVAKGCDCAKLFNFEILTEMSDKWTVEDILKLYGKPEEQDLSTMYDVD